jgi:hypothetical protein
MAQTSKKSQEIDMRTIMQGLEEFATFMSFQGSSSDMRIISVETVPPKYYNSNYQLANLKPSPKQRGQYKSLPFSDRLVQ